MNFDQQIACKDAAPPSESSSSGISFQFNITANNRKCSQPPPTDPKDMTDHADIDADCNDVEITTTSTSSGLSDALLSRDCRGRAVMRKIPDVNYELCLAKSILQQYSTISGDNLFDHLSDVIQRVMDERPPNVIDFFEEFSRCVREQKFHMPDRFPPEAIYEETRTFRMARKQLMSMCLPYNEDYMLPNAGEEGEEEQLAVAKPCQFDLKIDIADKVLPIFHTFNDRIQYMQFLWGQCGFSLSNEDIFLLACSMNRLQLHPSIMQCRFWGYMNGVKAPYYIVEAYLTRDEIDARIFQMKEEMRKQMEGKSVPCYVKSQGVPGDASLYLNLLPSHIGPELIPGAVGWGKWPEEELDKMIPMAKPVPLPVIEEVFDVPPEPVGYGVNRYTYFVVNSLSDEWTELPIVTPRQILASRRIKKFLTGNLENDVVSYPCFPGKEKHYLRCLISRITAGTYVAPKGYYRKMTARERRLFEGIYDEGEEEEEEEEEKDAGEGEEEQEEEIDNDIVLLKNEKYKAPPLSALDANSKWVHIRPHILKQGRVIWYDEEKARRDRERAKRRQERLCRLAEMEEEEENLEEEEEDAEEDGYVEGADREMGPAMMSPCSEDENADASVPWVRRYTSRFTNKNERLLMMRSNVWPGAYSFVYEDFCESIYIGWGNKHVARNFPWTHISPISAEFPHGPDDFIEATDPTVEMEEAYRLALMKRQQKPAIGEDLGEFDPDEEEEGDDEEEEEEEE